METKIPAPSWQFIRRNPLVPAALLFLLGLTLANFLTLQISTTLLLATTFLIAWLLAELLLTAKLRTLFTHTFLAGAITLSGTTFWNLNQHAVEPTHIARFTSDEEAALTAKIRVIVPPPADSDHHGNLYWIGEVTAIFTNQGWLPSHGTVKIKWRAGPDAPDLHTGQLVNAYGWLTQPPPPQNPGALDMRQTLANDRIFAQIRIPRTTGIQLEDANPLDRPNYLTRFRLFLRQKLLLHTLPQDTDAAHAMVALLLGYRDPTIDDISRNFADAGVAHLLAISGAHIVFIAAFFWMLLRFLPISPRLRQLLTTLCVLAYVIATPCGPPVLRAAIILVMLLLTRLLGRPRMMMNALALALLFLVLLRPTDIQSVGFQLTFICTASLILLAEPLHNALFKTWLEKKSQLANLSANPGARRRLELLKPLLALFVASFIGTTSSAPFLLLHFGQFTPYATLSGIIALPMVAFTMLVSLLQLTLELLSTHAALLFAPISTAITSAMLWTIKSLAQIPGTAIPLRAPPPWLVALLYIPLILWILRKPLHLTRALAANLTLAVLAATIFWYTLTAPLNKLTMQILSIGQGSSILIRTPTGQLLLLNAGSRDQPDILDFALRPALRIQGAKIFDALLLTSLDSVHASAAADVLTAFHPPLLLTSPIDWEHRNWTLAGASLEETLKTSNTKQIQLQAGQTLNLGRGLQVQTLWPPSNQPFGGLVLLWSYANQKILMLDAAGIDAANLLTFNHIDLNANAIILLGPQRGARDEDLRNLLAPNGTPTIIWSGRTPFASKIPLPNELNSAAHYITLEVNQTGQLTIQPKTN